MRQSTEPFDVISQIFYVNVISDSEVDSRSWHLTAETL